VLHQRSSYACPPTGPIKYVSDSANFSGVIDAYVGKFAGQAPCGQITSELGDPIGLYVDTTTHDLYVANFGGQDVLVFHRGQTTPYNTYTDPTGQDIWDVTVAKDGTVIASNIFQTHGIEAGSISTWIGGPHGGKFVGNFPMLNSRAGGFITVDKNDTVYFDEIESKPHTGGLWHVSCPAGACGTQTHVAGVTLLNPGGLAFDAEGDLLAMEQETETVDTFELPNPKPKTLHVAGGPGFAINELDHHLFVAANPNADAVEYLYPSGKLVGSVPCGTPCDPLGVAIDP
jgi:DNA-binding beta-propeller fold protein YncE